MSYIPPEPHKFFKRDLGRRERFIRLLEYNRKYNWWDVEKFSIGESYDYSIRGSESMEKNDKWEPISASDYYCAMAKLGRALTDIAALSLVDIEKPEPEVTGIKKWFCDLMGVKGIPNEQEKQEDPD